MTSVLLLLLGLGVLTAGAHLLVQGAASLARRFGLSDLVVGLTVVAFGTSAPELAVSLKASLGGQPGIALGNVIGSNIFNVAVILGLAAVICPLTVHLHLLRHDMPILLGVSGLFAVLLMTGGGLHRVEGAVLLAGLFVYTIRSVRAGRREAANAPPDRSADPARSGPALRAAVIATGAGLALLVLGARLFVDHAVDIARSLGLSEAVIGLTIVAAGTSMPELATSVVAALRRQTDIAVGNIVGSNLFNILGIAGAAALAAPIDRAGLRTLDLAVMVGTSIVLLPLMRSGFRIVRWEGALLLSCFAAYLWFTWPH